MAQSDYADSIYAIGNKKTPEEKSMEAEVMVILALLPAAGFGIYQFGIPVLLLIVATVAGSLTADVLYHIICVSGRKTGKELSSKHSFGADAEKAESPRQLYDMAEKTDAEKGDFSALLTGLLLALALPAGAPWWIGLLGGIFAALVIKIGFGDMGGVFLHPAMGARCFLLITFKSIMTNFECDAYTGATPLVLMQEETTPDILSLFTGNAGGTIGEASVTAVLIGACFLLITGVIDLKISGSYLVSFTAFLWLFGGHGFDIVYIAAQLAGGGLLFAVFFIATESKTKPVTKRGQYLYGIFLGILTAAFRIFGPSAEGISYVIILGNLLIWMQRNIRFRKTAV